MSVYNRKKLTVPYRTKLYNVLLIAFSLPKKCLVFFKVSIGKCTSRYFIVLKSQLLVSFLKFHFL